MGCGYSPRVCCPFNSSGPASCGRPGSSMLVSQVLELQACCWKAVGGLTNCRADGIFILLFLFLFLTRNLTVWPWLAWTSLCACFLSVGIKRLYKTKQKTTHQHSPSPSPNRCLPLSATLENALDLETRTSVLSIEPFTVLPEWSLQSPGSFSSFLCGTIGTVSVLD